jgi:hypothetical protein
VISRWFQGDFKGNSRTVVSTSFTHPLYGIEKRRLWETFHDVTDTYFGWKSTHINQVPRNIIKVEDFEVLIGHKKLKVQVQAHPVCIFTRNQQTFEVILVHSIWAVRKQDFVESKLQHLVVVNLHG